MEDESPCRNAIPPKIGWTTREHGTKRTVRTQVVKLFHLRPVLIRNELSSRIRRSFLLHVARLHRLPSVDSGLGCGFLARVPSRRRLRACLLIRILNGRARLLPSRNFGNNRRLRLSGSFALPMRRHAHETKANPAFLLKSKVL